MANQEKKQPPKEPEYIPLDDSAYVWTTYDLNCSAALLCAGFELLTVDKGADMRKSLFVFRKKDGLEEVVSLYLSDRLEVRARQFADSIKALKNRLYSE